MHKQSKYNYIIPQDERFVYFNGISTRSFSMSAEEHEKLKPLFSDPISFEINYPSIFKKFTEWGFFVKEDIDEVDILRYRHKMAVIDSRDYHLVISPTLECNFSCWYCYQEHPKGYMNEDTKKKVMAHIKYMIEKKHITRLDLGWFGGEPLLYFDEVVYPISSYAKSLCQKHDIPYRANATTNGSKIDLAMIEKMKEIDLTSFQITIDGDPKRHNLIRNEKGKPSFDIIMNNICNLCEKIKNIHINLRLNYDDETLKSKELEKVFESIPKKYRKLISPNFQRVWQTFTQQNNEDKVSENLRRLHLSDHCKSLGYVTGSLTNTFFIGTHYKCYADRSYYTKINYDGKLYSCTARDYTEDYEIGILLENGKIVYNVEKQIKKLARATFENEMCLSCQYLPLCLGPCSQKIMETDRSQLAHICNLKLTEISPKTAILDYHNRKNEAIRMIAQAKKQTPKTTTKRKKK